MGKISLMEERKKQGLRIREERKKQKLTLKTMSEMLGCSEQAVSQYERGTRPVRSEMLEKIARVLQIPVQSLFDETTVFLSSGEAAEQVWKNYAAKIDQLRSFLNVEDRPQEAAHLLKLYSQLNSVGQRKLLEYAADMRNVYKYCKPEFQAIGNQDPTEN